MAKRILTPIDARERRETIVPVVAALARETGAAVRLLRVFPVPGRVIGNHGQTVAFSDQEMARLTHEGLSDLRHLEADLSGVPVDAVVRFGDPVEEIVLEAEAFDAALVALTADQQGYLRTALAPGVADRVARRVAVPTLNLRG